MSHPQIENKTPFAFEALYLSDENAFPLLVTIVQATYALGADGTVLPAEDQKAIPLAGQLYGEPGHSSYKYEPQFAFTKPATDVVLIGHAFAPHAGAVEAQVRLRVGPLDKQVRVVGDRFWFRSLGIIATTSPEPFESIPLIYERAFGGWDRSLPDPDRHSRDARNPVGTGFRSKHGRFEDGLRLPNIEDPKHPVREYGDAPSPAGFGFTSPDWQPRASFAGTYDEKWTNERMPLLPADFDRRFFNAASSGLTAQGYLDGGEPVSVEGASPCGPLLFQLPVQAPPTCRVQLTGRMDAEVKTKLDTVVIDTDENILLLMWRGYLPVRKGPHSVASIQVEAEGANILAGVG